ncbi:MAG TPA: putative glycoside hydrolase [Candidatus Krumholzibacteria bacterium]|nr:putative glycoside hydrolase [Candidatus Krumholzibacteria bacterium]HPD72404.1 putative glycoside hydrolase [Candidatus Krumholzibacteria bacterium]HRY40664.1 putative glycoside hydrolase [Candidatus Krumholzibacteria bacterium]
MQNATATLLVLGATAVVLTAASPSASAATAVAGYALESASGDTLRHTVESGDSLNRIASRYRERAGWYGQADCLAAIREANGLATSNLLRPGQRLVIPVPAEPAPPRAARPTRDGADLRGLYLPGALWGSRAVFARVDSFTLAGGNGVVFDAKDIDGGINFPSATAAAILGREPRGAVIPDLRMLIEKLHERDLWVVARLALFLDGRLGRDRPDLALSAPDGSPWTERGCAWMDPALADVRAYNAGLALELARAGVDEVQIDYVRFPTNGWRGDWQGDLETTAARRRAVITGFVAALHDTLGGVGCRLSADLFGIMAWDRTVDLALTGQHVPSLALHLDVICPMIYPSHFGPGFAGLANPGDHPAAIVAEGIARFREQAGPDLLIRPWLQAFPWRVADYDRGYVSAQIAAAADAGAAGWCLWNPSGRYEVARGALATAAAIP